MLERVSASMEPLVNSHEARADKILVIHFTFKYGLAWGGAGGQSYLGLGGTSAMTGYASNEAGDGLHWPGTIVFDHFNGPTRKQMIGWRLAKLAGW